MAIANIYLMFDGNCEEAFNYYQTVFGGSFSYVGRYGDLPSQEGFPVLADIEKNKIENICLPISKETFLMGSDLISSFGKEFKWGNNFSVYLEAQNMKEADSLFNGLSKEGVKSIPMTKAHWGDYFGMCTDKFGINWFINYSVKSV